MKMLARIEIPAGSRNKYELKDGKLILDRVVPYPYPANYGYIPETLCDDGDPLDIFVFSDEPIVSLAYVNVEVLGVINMLDNGKQDPKLIGTVEDFNIQSIHYIDILAFLGSYKRGIKDVKLDLSSFGLKELMDKCNLRK